MSDLPLIDQFRGAIDPILGAFVIEAIECGIYTVIFVQAIWKLHRKGGKMLYILALVLLWIAVIISFAGDFYNIRTAFVFNNDTIEDIDRSLGQTLSLPWYIPGLIGITLSDAILIWRCHTLWNNKYILIVLGFLLCTTFGLTLYDDIGIDPSRFYAQAFAILSSFLTTVSATFLIALKIIIVTRGSPVRRYYTRVVDIIVQSAAPLSLVLFAFAVLNLNELAHPGTVKTRHGQSVYALGAYLQYIQLPIAGLAPTLIAFRVADEEPQMPRSSNDRTWPLSRLRFRRTTQHSNIGGRNAGIYSSEQTPVPVDLEAGLSVAAQKVL